MAANEFAVADFLLRVGGGRHDSVNDRQLIRRNFQLLRGALDEQATRFCGGVAQCDPAELDAGRSRCAALIARELRIAHHDLDALEGDVEFFGNYLADGDVHALAHVHLAEVGGHVAVGKYCDPRIELIGCQGRLRARGFVTQRFVQCTGNAERDDECTGRLQKVAAGERGLVHVFLLMPSSSKHA